LASLKNKIIKEKKMGRTNKNEKRPGKCQNDG
jgi:hypothetical protein